MKRFIFVFLVIALFLGTCSVVLAKETVVELTVWLHLFEDWNQNYFSEKIEAYNALGRGIKVNVEFIPTSAWEERLIAAQAVGDAPDVYDTNLNRVMDGARQQSMLPLNELLPQEAIDDLLPGVSSMITVDGKLYGYPSLTELTPVMYYRTDLFQEAGLDAPPKTWDELVEYAKLLTTSTVYGVNLPAAYELAWAVYPYMYMVDQHFALNEDWSAPHLDGAKEVAKLFASILHEEAAPQEAIASLTSAWPFTDGNFAMYFSGSYLLPQILELVPDLPFSIAPVPSKDGQSSTATLSGWAYVIDAKTDAPEAAADFLYWMLADNPETIGEFYLLAQMGKLTARKSVQEWLMTQDVNQAILDAMNEIASTSVPEPAYPWDISVQASNYIQAIMLGIDEQQAYDTYAPEIQNLIDSKGIAGTRPY